jgi:hypothetical protein
MKHLLAALLFVALPASPSVAQTQPLTVASTAAPGPAPEHPATPDQVSEYFKLIRLDQTR